MRLAVIQHALRSTPSQNVEALVAQTSAACEFDADAVVIPHLDLIDDHAEISRDFADQVAGACGDRGVVLVRFGTEAEGVVPSLERTPLGSTAVLLGDRCLDPAVSRSLYEQRPDAVVMRPCNESPLQAEAFIEWALAWSLSVSGLVMVCELVGGEKADSLTGTAAVGGSCVASLGEVIAEAGDDEETLIVELDTPVVLPEPREPLPELPPILVQRWAHHHGTKPSVDYLADMS